jgi:alpha-tubulin suppressor-like RCC1 family protein
MTSTLCQRLPTWPALWSAVLLTTLLLVACGGGGYGSDGGGYSGGGGGPTPTASISGPSRVVADTRYSYQSSLTGGPPTGVITWNWGDGAPDVDASTSTAPKVWHKPGSFTAKLLALIYGYTTTASQAVVVTGAPVASSYAHTCALQPSGSVLCWGYGIDGELGNGSSASSTTSVVVTGISDAIALAAGTHHTCAVQASGAVRCWGLNSGAIGQLGNGIPGNANTSVAVTGLTDAVALAAGSDHTCALQAGGTVRCWGLNGNGQLGDGTTVNSSTSVAVTGISDAVALAAGDGHTCALQASGTVRCWGFNGFGQLGDGTLVDSTTSVAVTGLTNAVALGAGLHTCALLDNGTVRCWGYNGYGQVGNGSTNNAVTSPVAGITDAVALAVHEGAYSCVLQTGGTASCWGYNNYGQLGNGRTATAVVTPTPVTGLSDAVALYAGVHHACALLGGGALSCWGWGRAGQLGDGTAGSTNIKTVPTPVLDGAVFWR